jgi:hypothetical protein
MEIKGFGSYTSVEHHLATLTIDEKNELYFSGELDQMLDEAERESKSRRYANKSKSIAKNNQGELIREIL